MRTAPMYEVDVDLLTGLRTIHVLFPLMENSIGKVLDR